MTHSVDALPIQPAKSRLLITLVVDTSSSMLEDDRIGELNQALSEWRAELMKDDHLRRHGEIALVTFGNGHVQAVDPSGRTTQATTPYVPIAEFSPPALQAGGVTPMVEGLQYALDLLAARRQFLRKDGIGLVNRPLVYLITDGVPTDSQGHRSDRWRAFAPALRQQENGKHLLFFAFGVKGAEAEVLSGLAPQSWRLLADFNFAEVLTFVSASIETAAAASARSEPAEVVHAKVQDRLDKESRMDRFLRGGPE
ncbi:vWA domain-containing protein [Actinocrispum wychmicini]|uniref:Uncharacterized protein YegL n=1 Tax=Actinocrispum wychmicini TaxID=1213861 RepID=A0A4R2IV74_9PSEU|nr:VWA domain-containing protein [Actinocrispum wychmicini]TCO48018.1 uncharacterized protein YegL [Actinocrispum wychmicini]